jgi:hypothetical protein
MYVDIYLHRLEGAARGEKAMQVQAAMNTEACAGWVGAPSARESAGFTDEMNDVREFAAEGKSCAKGIAMAIALEAAMAVGVYGIWQAFHIFQ